MKQKAFLFIPVLYYFLMPSTSAASCEKNYFYTYRFNPNFRGGFPYSPYRHHPLIEVCGFNCRPKFYRIVDTAAITCSNVSENVLLNHTYRTEYYNQDLVVVDSKIPNFPSNTSLSTFRTIRKLILRNLSIENISPGAFKGLEALKTLDLSLNKLEEVPEGVFDNLSTVTLLNLSKNRIKSVEKRSVVGLVQLRELYLNDNSLTVLTDNVFKDLVVLEVLDVSDNPLVEFGDVGFNNIKKLVARNSLLKNFDVDLSNSTILHFDLSGGRLERIDFNKFPQMENMNLANNSLSVLYSVNSFKCGSVYLSHNYISEVEVFPKIRELDLSHNQIRFLKIVDHQQNSSLEYLDLSVNEISEIVPGIFWGHENLKSVNMKRNEIKVLGKNSFVNCSSLVAIDLSENDIAQIEDNVFNNNNKLNTLNLSYNRLETLNSKMIQGVNDLKKLYFDHNEISWFDVQELLLHFKKLKEVALNNNPWSCNKITDILLSLNAHNVTVVDHLSRNNGQEIMCRFNKET